MKGRVSGSLAGGRLQSHARAYICVAAVIASPIANAANSTAVPSFTGAYAETFEQFGRRFFTNEERIPILTGIAALSGTRLETATKGQFLMCAYYASPVDGKFFMGADQYGSSMTISFAEPVSALGAYWANVPDVRGCGGMDSTYSFFDAAGKLLEVVSFPAGPTANWDWRGWTFATPVKTITATGDYLLIDGMQANLAVVSALANISTRSFVQTGDNVLIGGFIVSGDGGKTVLVRGIGPSLGSSGLAQAMADPTLELHSASSTLASNDNWKETQRAVIQDSGLAPTNDLEAAIIATLNPGSYTAIVTGKNASSGVGLVELYDVGKEPNARLSNISSRSFVGAGDKVMIGGFILARNTKVLVRAIGPSLATSGVGTALANPLLELHGQDGAVLAANDDWKQTQQAEIEATGIPPTNDKESAAVQTLPAGTYTAIVRGVNDTSGTALVEVYGL